ncbi:MAG: right-handed parallel beta-helix repeat-containing protein [Deltaproteobacteria bacterium]|nr:right-handed parallel beta-helix repeat-containing protein [Deltaproteobacteria bacterium]
MPAPSAPFLVGCVVLGLACSSDPGAVATESGATTTSAEPSTSATTGLDPGSTAVDADTTATGGATTSGADGSTGGDTGGSDGLQWLDPLGYAKPPLVDIAEPDEATTANKYYVDLAAGAGDECSEAAPCLAFADLVGKPGTTGGPAYVYVRGRGQLWLYEETFFGSPGQEIVIKPWGGDTATFTGNSNTSSMGVHDLIIDGGLAFGIEFENEQCGDVYAFTVASDNTTVYRTRAHSTCPTGSLLFAVGPFWQPSNVRFVNNEGYGCDAADGFQCSFVYAGPGDGGGYDGLLIQNNIIRNMGGEGIEINPRVTSSGLEIAGNAIHDVGKATCAGDWGCRPGITVAVQSGDGNDGTRIVDNLVWDTGSSCIWDRGGGDPAPIYAHNTCFDYAKVGSDPWPFGISSYQDGGTATLANNIIFAPNGTAAFDGSAFTMEGNICDDGSCAMPYSAQVFASIDPDALEFLQLAGGGPAVDAAQDVGVAIDYLGHPRPQGDGFDIGAFEAR